MNEDLSEEINKHLLNNEIRRSISRQIKKEIEKAKLEIQEFFTQTYKDSLETLTYKIKNVSKENDIIYEYMAKHAIDMNILENQKLISELKEKRNSFLSRNNTIQSFE